MSHSRADHLIYLSHVTADKRRSSHIMVRLYRDTGVPVLRAQVTVRRRWLLLDEEGLFVVHWCCHAMLTTKVPLSRCGPGQRSRSSQPSEIKDGSGYQSPWGSSVISPYQHLGSRFMREPCKMTPRMFSVECNSPALPNLFEYFHWVISCNSSLQIALKCLMVSFTYSQSILCNVCSGVLMGIS